MKKLIPADALLVPDNAKRVFQGRIFDVYQWPQVLYDGSELTFEMCKRPDTVAVICIDRDKLLVLEDEQPNREMRRTFPGGRVDPEDVDILSAAKREVQEETGYSFHKWRLLAVQQREAKIEWFIYLLLAWDVSDQQAPHVDAGERITVNQASFDEVKELVMAKAGYLGESMEVFEHVNSLDELLAWPAFTGKEVDR